MVLGEIEADTFSRKSIGMDLLGFGRIKGI